MKSNFSTAAKITMSVMFVVAFQAIALAQMTSWTWDKYKTKFDVPDDFQVTQNDASAFIAKNDDIALSIYPREDENLSYDDMINSLLRWANDNNVSNQSECEYVEDLNGYWGCIMDGYSGGYPVGLLLLIDPDYPEISLYVWISYSEGFDQAAVEILMSFTPN